MGVDVDEAGRQRLAAELDGLASGERSRRSDRRDAVAVDGYVAGLRRRAAAVDDRAVGEDEIVSRRCHVRTC
jgi:hypothetical protein